MRFRYLLIFAVAFAIVCNSCREKGRKFINEGEIHYTIDYLGNIGTISKDIMPKSMVLSFKNNKILLEISSPIGNSGILNLANPQEGIFDTYFSMFTLRYFYACKPGERQPGFEAMSGMEIRKTSKTSVVCGYNCKNAEVTFPFDRNKIYTIWYTNEINLKNPNATNPFYQIDGVLMNFFFIFGRTELHFDAETVYKKEIDDKTFERREKYVRVSKEQIDNLINKMTSL